MVETKPKAAPKKEAPKKAAPKKEAPKKEAPKKAAPKKDAPKKAAAPKKDAPKKAAAPKKEAPKKGAPKKEASKKLTPKKVVVKKEAPKKVAKVVKKLSAKKEARLAKKVALKAEKLKRANPLKKIQFKAIQKQKLAVGSVRFGRKKRAIIKKIAKPHLKKMDPANKKQIVYTTRTVKNKKGETRVIKFKKPPNYYPTEDKRRNRPAQKKVRPNYLKDSLKPGTVAILVAGEHKGKRVVFLKQLQSGLCLVTGPYGLNRCPLRRVNQIYLIGTSTRIRLPPSFKVPRHINDEYFRKVRINNKKNKKEEGDIFNIKPKKYVVNQVKRHEQRNIDMVILKSIRARKDRKQLCAYMTNKFSLTSNQFPHELKF